MRKHAIFVALTLNIDRYPKNEQRTEIKCSALMENTGCIKASQESLQDNNTLQIQDKTSFILITTIELKLS